MGTFNAIKFLTATIPTVCLPVTVINRKERQNRISEYVQSIIILVCSNEIVEFLDRWFKGFIRNEIMSLQII